jgi:uncharacterized membrane protein YesL
LSSYEEAVDLELRGFMGGLYRLTEWITRLAYINVLWLAFSIFSPVFVLLTLYTINPATAAQGFYFQTFMIVGIVAPFTLFPATSAMFAIVRKFVQGIDDSPVFRTFFKGFKENYLKSMIAGIIFVIACFMIYINYNFYLQQKGTLQVLTVLFLVLTVILVITLFYFFCFIVHIDAKFMRLIKNSLLMTIGNPIGSIVILFGNVAVLYFSFFRFTFLVLFFMGSLMAFLTYWMFQRGFDKMMAKVEAMQNKEEEAKEDKLDDVKEHSGTTPNGV